MKEKKDSPKDLELKPVAFIRISDGVVFLRDKEGKYRMKDDRIPGYMFNAYSAERLSIKEFAPVLSKNHILYYSNFYKTAGKNSDYIPECKRCGMSWYNCLCSHEDD